MKKYTSTFNKLKRDIDLRNVIRFNNMLFGLLANKYLVGFLDLYKEYATKRFLKGCLLKQTKFHRKALEPFFAKWKHITEVLHKKG